MWVSEPGMCNECGEYRMVEAALPALCFDCAHKDSIRLYCEEVTEHGVASELEDQQFEEARKAFINEFTEDYHG